MEYFEDGTWRAAGDGCCSGDDCPRGNTVIPRGEGYLYISPEIVELRFQFRSHESASAEMDRRIRARFGRPVHYVLRIGPALLCVQCARKKGIDLEIAAYDAKYWWVTGTAPLRSTPSTGSGLADQEKRSWARGIDP